MSPARRLRGDRTEYVLSVRITAEERRALRALAQVNAMTLSGLAAEAIAELAGDLLEHPPMSLRRRLCAHCRRGCHTDDVTPS